MTNGILERSMIEGLHAKRLRSTIEEWLNDDGITTQQRRRAEEVKSGIALFDSAMSEAAAELQSEVTEAVAEVDVLLDPERLDGRLRMLVPGDSFDRVLDYLRHQGFVPMFPLSQGAEVALRRGRHDVSMIAPEGPITSVSVTSSKPKRAPAFAQRFRPAVSDLRLISLPTWAWWAYWGVKPIRLLARILSIGWREQSSSPFLRTPPGLVRSLLDLAELSQDVTLVDLGCGDGRVLISAASTFGCQGRGIEMDPQLAALAESNVARAGLDALVSIERGDIGDIPLEGPGVVFAFLPVRQLEASLTSILGRMSPGARLVAHEQEGADFSPPADTSRLLVTDTGVTVAHVWTAPARDQSGGASPTDRSAS